jgi:hypothetical protein
LSGRRVRSDLGKNEKQVLKSFFART